MLVYWTGSIGFLVNFYFRHGFQERSQWPSILIFLGCSLDSVHYLLRRDDLVLLGHAVGSPSQKALAVGWVRQIRMDGTRVKGCLCLWDTELRFRPKTWGPNLVLPVEQIGDVVPDPERKRMTIRMESGLQEEFESDCSALWADEISKAVKIARR